MRQFLIPGILVCGALSCGPIFAAPQDTRPPYHSDRPYADQAARADEFRSGQMLFANVRTDLDRAENNLPQYAGARYQFDRARGELSELQRQWDESAYEPRQIDVVIRVLERAVSSDDLYARDRDRLMTDLNELRDFRDSH